MDTVAGIANQPVPRFLYVFLSFFLFFLQFDFQYSWFVASVVTRTNAGLNKWFGYLILWSDRKDPFGIQKIKLKWKTADKTWDGNENEMAPCFHCCPKQIQHGWHILYQFLLTLPLAPAVTLNKDVLQCSATELSEGLVCFVTEVKRPDGQPYPPDRLFYLCLSIQQARRAASYT